MSIYLITPLRRKFSTIPALCISIIYQIEPARDPLLISEHGHFRLIHDGGMYPFVERTIDTAFRFYNLIARSRIIICSCDKIGGENMNVVYFSSILFQQKRSL